MVQTTHGWTIPGTAHLGEESDQPRARCGGLNSCPLCIEEAEQFVQNLMNRNDAMTLTMPPNIPETARKLVYHYIQQNRDSMFELSSVYVVWFSKTLQNWKALVGTETNDGRHYEVTHNGDKHETYIDVYRKTNNICIKDEDLPVETQHTNTEDFADTNMVLLGSQIGPHSRACGTKIHRHGPDCSPDCPTCYWLRNHPPEKIGR